MRSEYCEATGKVCIRALTAAGEGATNPSKETWDDVYRRVQE